MIQPEFDRYSQSYGELLKDPIRDRFIGGVPKLFHVRKRDLIREYFRRGGVSTRNLRYLDVGCGRGELISLLRDDFSYVAGCDPSPGMLKFAEGVDTRVQPDPAKLPFNSQEFDLVTVVCVYHHVPPASRLSLTREVCRVLKPGGVFAIVEHNPYNPITRRIVGRAPVDADAILLRPAEARKSMHLAGLAVHSVQYFLYFPEWLYRRIGYRLEVLLRNVPIGGQYAVFGSKSCSELSGTVAVEHGSDCRRPTK